MAQKRMFDKGLLETDAFMDMPMPTKALYFLLGMEADDEGFVSPARVMRIYGGNTDDLKVLIAKKFVIQFESGVIVITDWKKNNWLDSRRVKKTVYEAEKALLSESNEKYLLLSECLASIEENRVEEKRAELAKASLPLEDLKLNTTNKPNSYKKFRDVRRIESGRPPMTPRKSTEKQKAFLQRVKSLDYFHEVGVRNGFTYLEEEDEQANKKFIGISRAFEKRYPEKWKEVIDWWFSENNAWCDYHPSNFFSISTWMKFDNKKIQKYYYD